MREIPAIRLAQSCAYSADAPEWEQFVEAVIPVVALAARRLCFVWGESSNSVVGEIVQEVFLRLCDKDRKILREIEDRGNASFLKLLRTITASVVTDYFRRQVTQKRGGRSGTDAYESNNPAKFYSVHQGAHSVEWPTLISQLDDLLQGGKPAISARDRNLFWLYYRQGLTVDAISRIPSIGLSTKGVESALLRITRFLRERIVQGKPPRKIPQNIAPRQSFSKGFDRVVAIDSVKQR